MATHTTSITANGTYLIATLHKPAHADTFFATISVFGTFSSGSVALQLSPDSGTTKITLDDPFTGAAVAVTANKVINLETGRGAANNDQILLYATLSGAGSPALTVKVHDNT